jgi:hypothetical protein
VRHDHDAMMLVRADLCERLASLQCLAGRLPAGDLSRRVDAIRLTAAAYGLTPVVRVAEALERGIAEGGCPARLYLDRLGDAIGCGRLDEAASEAMLASVSVRFGS